MRFTVDTTPKRYYGDKRNVVIFAWFPRLMDDEKTLIWLGRYVKQQTLGAWVSGDSGPCHVWETDSLIPYEPEETPAVDKVATFWHNAFFTTFVAALIAIFTMLIIG
jgi:hypothetical protein